MIYLYVKTHNKTGLKYLGKTIADPFTYKGSGTYWKRHIDKHGYDVTTEVIFQTEDKVIFKEKALYFSELFDVVKSKEWANQTKEEGQGGNTNNYKRGKGSRPYSKGKTGPKKGYKQNEEHINKRTIAQQEHWNNNKRTPWNKNIKMSEEQIQKRKKTCSKCNKSFSANYFSRHFDTCTDFILPRTY